MELVDGERLLAVALTSGDAGFSDFDGSGTVQLDITTFLQNLASTPTIQTSPTGKPFSVNLDIHDVDFSGTVTYTYTPEPASLLLMTTVFGLAWVVRRGRG